LKMRIKMQTRVVDEKDVDAILDQRIREGLCISFPRDASVFSRNRAWHGSAPAWNVILEQDDRIIAHCGIVDRTIKVGNEFLHIAGVQNVYVMPTFRGKGFCDGVMNSAMGDAGRRGYDCGLLFCVPELEKVYARCGWRLLPNENVYRMDENGEILPLPGKNIAMFFPLKRKGFPAGDISLEGNDW